VSGVFAEDRVLVGVINRRRDFRLARDQHWYRIPADRLAWSQVEYVAFFFSRAFADQNGAIHWYAPCLGWELVRRRDLLPHESEHPRADALYYRVALGTLIARQPPIRNASRHAISFIYTSGERFAAAGHIRDLFGAAEFAVTRVYRGKR
jgi:hypothetical protein